jgi:CheY-like chemotaxis protein
MLTPDEVPASIDVLIADDDSDNRESLRLLLETDGYACAEAETGQEALDIARHSPPRLVLLDLMMPYPDGFTVARKLRTDPRTHGVHIYCLTGRSDQAARTRAERAGCELFLTKPVTPVDLLNAVDVAMRT